MMPEPEKKPGGRQNPHRHRGNVQATVIEVPAATAKVPGSDGGSIHVDRDLVQMGEGDINILSRSPGLRLLASTSAIHRR